MRRPSRDQTPTLVRMWPCGAVVTWRSATGIRKDVGSGRAAVVVYARCGPATVGTPMHSLVGLDVIVLAAYLVGVAGLGCWFMLRQRGADRFMTGGRDLPAWVVGLSIFGTFVSSISFL